MLATAISTALVDAVYVCRFDLGVVSVKLLNDFRGLFKFCVLKLLRIIEEVDGDVRDDNLEIEPLEDDPERYKLRLPPARSLNTVMF